MNGFHFHFWQHSRKDVTVLRQAGFASQEIGCLCRLRQSHQQNLLDLPSGTQNRLQFARWLVQRGKLNEGLR